MLFSKSCFFALSKKKSELSFDLMTCWKVVWFSFSCCRFSVLKTKLGSWKGRPAGKVIPSNSFGPCLHNCFRQWPGLALPPAGDLPSLPACLPACLLWLVHSQKPLRARLGTGQAQSPLHTYAHAPVVFAELILREGSPWIQLVSGAGVSNTQGRRRVGERKRACPGGLTWVCVSGL